MARNFQALIELLVNELEKPSVAYLGRAALNAMAETGKVSDETMSEALTQVQEFRQSEDLAYLLEPGVALSCGVTANAFCRIFAGTEQFANSCTSLDALRRLVADGRQRVIRISMYGHTFIIEQTKTPGPKAELRGNIYQSNVAVINNAWHLGITIQKYLRENPNPVDLDDYIGKLITLTSSGIPSWTQLSIYKKLFTVKSYRNNPNVRRITSDELIAERSNLTIKSITWQFFNESDVLQNICKIFNAKEIENTVAAHEAKRLYFSSA